MADYYLKVNDRYFNPTATLKDAAGTLVNLTGAAVKFLMRSANDPSVVKVNAAANILDALNGKVSYTWAAGDTNTAGDYYVEWQVIFSNGSEATFPSDSYQVFTITPEIA